MTITTEAHLRAILETVIDGIITLSKEGVVQTVNPAAERIFGYQANEVVGHNVKMLMPDPYAREHDGYLHNYLTTGDKKVIGIGREVTGRRKDGSTFPMELAVSEMELDGERMFTGIVRDITERKKAELSLRDSEARIRAIVETVVDGIVTIDAQGIVQSLNPAAESVFGYTEDEVVGLNVNELMPQPYAGEHDNYLHNYLTTGNKKVIGIGREVTGKRKDGSTFPMELAVSEMEINGERMFTGIVRDITERKKLERMKSEFVSTVSHELRTPLTSIRGALNLVLGKSAAQLADKPRRMLEMAERNSERLTMLINDILDLEKIESGALAFKFSMIDLVDLTRRALEENEGYARQYEVRLLMVTALEQASIYGDENRLLQVFANLISNAVKYSSKNGQVEIILAENQGSYRVTVEDHGSGIPEGFRSRIFQRFAQADSSDTREKGGTGLGLSIVKAIVERHNGSIAYETEHGRGTRFYFDLPGITNSLEKSAAGGKDTLRAAPDNMKRFHILHVEDDLDIIQVVQALFDDDVEYSSATSVPEARRYLQENQFDLVLLDLDLATGSGEELLAELKSCCPVVIFAAEVPGRRITEQVTAVLTKSMTSNEVIRTMIMNVLEGRYHE